MHIKSSHTVKAVLQRVYLFNFTNHEAADKTDCLFSYHQIIFLLIFSFILITNLEDACEDIINLICLILS